eukprot:3941574-Rhodomonas_salina.1
MRYAGTGQRVGGAQGSRRRLLCTLICSGGCVSISSLVGTPGTARNQTQETAILVQIVLKMRFLVLDFGV